MKKTDMRVSGRDKLLFTPGPLATSVTVKEAMLRDLGSLDSEFLELVQSIRSRLLALGPYARETYECILMQGSGTYVVESVLSSVIPHNGKLMVMVNGAYGRRMAQIARIHGIALDEFEIAENSKFTPEIVAERLAASNGITHVALVHCETTSGMLNQVEEIGRVVSDANAVYIVDAMSSFGAIPIDMTGAHIDFLISSANKCIEGVPGFGFVLANRHTLPPARGTARTLSLDLLAFEQALNELDEEGGVRARGERYRKNHRTLCTGMKAMGFEAYLAEQDQSFIITSFRYPLDPAFDFSDFYSKLWSLGFVIYPGKLSKDKCFRIGTIGRIASADVEELLEAIHSVLLRMEVLLPAG
jgi:2-aminoethylphosphonate-pyruvate transaminase